MLSDLQIQRLHSLTLHLNFKLMEVAHVYFQLPRVRTVMLGLWKGSVKQKERVLFIRKLAESSMGPQWVHDLESRACTRSMLGKSLD
jgi:hypothetical protein